MNDYFLLYIRVIYQSYSLMRYAVSTSKILPNDYLTYVNIGDETENIAKKISEISAEISLFLVKSVVTSVSHVHHQNEFYDYLIERLQIKEDAASVTAGLAALNELQHETLLEKQNQEREEEQQREKIADDRFQIGLGLMTFLAALSAVLDSYEIAKQYFELAGTISEQVWFPLFRVLLGCCIIISMMSLFIFVTSVKDFVASNWKNKGGKNK